MARGKVSAERGGEGVNHSRQMSPRCKSHLAGEKNKSYFKAKRSLVAYLNSYSRAKAEQNPPKTPKPMASGHPRLFLALSRPYPPAAHRLHGLARARGGFWSCSPLGCVLKIFPRFWRGSVGSQAPLWLAPNSLVLAQKRRLKSKFWRGSLAPSSAGEDLLSRCSLQLWLCLLCSEQAAGGRRSIH